VEKKKKKKVEDEEENEEERESGKGDEEKKRMEDKKHVNVEKKSFLKCDMNNQIMGIQTYFKPPTCSTTIAAIPFNLSVA
jgi:hypothetical protein